jgi:hypothetical protein
VLVECVHTHTRNGFVYFVLIFEFKVVRWLVMFKVTRYCFPILTHSAMLCHFVIVPHATYTHTSLTYTLHTQDCTRSRSGCLAEKPDEPIA